MTKHDQKLPKHNQQIRRVWQWLAVENLGWQWLAVANHGCGSSLKHVLLMLLAMQTKFFKRFRDGSSHGSRIRATIHHQCHLRWLDLMN